MLEPDAPGNNPVKAPSLDDLIVALQKSFSRVSAITGKNRQDDTTACAMVVGPVKFSLSLNVEMDPSQDRLKVLERGSIHLSIDGTLQTDVRVAVQDHTPEGEA